MGIELPYRNTYVKPTHCKICKKELTDETEYTYLGYRKTECRPCKSEKAKRYAAKRKKAIAESRMF